MNLKTAVGETIRRIRHEQGRTLRQVADPYHYSYTFLSEIERGDKEASTTMLDTIAVSLKLSTAELLREIYEYLEEQNG